MQKKRTVLLIGERNTELDELNVNQPIEKKVRSTQTILCSRVNGTRNTINY